jgi:hypothetical protein
MVSNDITIFVGVDTSDGMAELADFQNKTNEAYEEYNMMISKVQKETLQFVRFAYSVFNQVRSIMTRLGYVFDPFLDAVLDTISVSVSGCLSMVAMSTAAGPFGVPMLLISALAFGVALGAQARAIEASLQAKESAQYVKNMLSSVDFAPVIGYGGG